MAGGKTFKDTFTVPTSGTFYTKAYSNWVSPISSVHLYSADAVVVTDCQYQTSNWKDERDLSGALGNQYFYAEPSASVGIVGSILYCIAFTLNDFSALS